jgi:hypothetical protein
MRSAGKRHGGRERGCEITNFHEFSSLTETLPEKLMRNVQASQQASAKNFSWPEIIQPRDDKMARIFLNRLKWALIPRPYKITQPRDIKQLCCIIDEFKIHFHLASAKFFRSA